MSRREVRPALFLLLLGALAVGCSQEKEAKKAPVAKSPSKQHESAKQLDSGVDRLL